MGRKDKRDAQRGSSRRRGGDRRTVKDLLTAGKDATELMLDLAFASVFLDEEKLGREVLRLEDGMDTAVRELRVMCMIATRSPEDAEELARVLAMVNAMEEIADAAEDIARVTLRQLGVPAALRDDMRHADEVTARVKIRRGSNLIGATLRDLALPSETGMWVIAVRREVEFVHGPEADYSLLRGDVLFLQGPADGVDLVRKMAGGQPLGLRQPTPPSGRISDLERAVDILIEMKNAAETAVGLAYSAVLFHDRGLASEVSGIEDTCDALFHDLQRSVLRAARDLEDDDLDDLRALLQIGQSAEAIADAAQEMTRLAEDTDDTPAVIRAALADTEERIADVMVADGGAVVNRSLRELKLRTAMGVDVLALQRAGRWVNKPRATRRLQVGDRLVVLAPEEGLARLREDSNDPRPIDEDPAALAS